MRAWRANETGSSSGSAIKPSLSEMPVEEWFSHQGESISVSIPNQCQFQS
jgi:hypothetical protein